jgi:hypothetical protein
VENEHNRVLMDVEHGGTGEITWVLCSALLVLRARPRLSTWRSTCVTNTQRSPVASSSLPLPVMFSAVIRRSLPSLRQTRPYTAAAHTQTAESSPPKLDDGEQAIYDKLSERFQPSQLLVQDVSGTPPVSSHTVQTVYPSSF